MWLCRQRVEQRLRLYRKTEAPSRYGVQSVIRRGNVSFNRVVLDRRGWEVKKLICCAEDLIATHDINTGKTNFELRDSGDIYLPFWHFWPDIDQNGAFKETIDGLRMEMKKVLNRIRQLL